MTNKPMLSVERELLERLTENWNGTDARIELRALLDKPSAERKPQRITDEYARGWNDCAAQYARLNGVKP